MPYIPGFVALSEQDAMTTVAELRNDKHYLRATSRSTQYAEHSLLSRRGLLITTYCFDAKLPAQSDTDTITSTSIDTTRWEQPTEHVTMTHDVERKIKNPITFSIFRSRLYAVFVSTFPVHYASNTETGRTKRQAAMTLTCTWNRTEVLVSYVTCVLKFKTKFKKFLNTTFSC